MRRERCEAAFAVLDRELPEAHLVLRCAGELERPGVGRKTAGVVAFHALGVLERQPQRGAVRAGARGRV